MALPITEETFDGYGTILHSSAKDAAIDMDGFRFVADVFKFCSDIPFTVGILTGKKREIKRESAEKHANTVEILVQLENDAIVYLGKPTVGDEPGELEEFLLRQGEAVALAQGAWHWVPYPVEEDACKTLVIFKENTGANDAVIKDI